VAAGELNIITIEDPADPRIAEYANLTDAELLARALDPERPETGLFMAEGELVVRQLIASRLRSRSVLLTPTRLHPLRDALVRLPAGTPVFVAAQPVMDRITGFHIHRGVLSSAERPGPPELEELLGQVGGVVVLEDLTNHDNVGGIFRATAALAGLPRALADGRRAGAAVLYSPRTCDPLYRKSIRVSLGSVFHLPFARLAPWPESLALLRERGFTVVALTPRAGARVITELDPNKLVRPALLLGAEGAGLSEPALAAADLHVRIPICGPMDSLNVVVAAGIALHWCLSRAG
jgi:tRNA G18 (ribose-2'-O)-methylase SpoU